MFKVIKNKLTPVLHAARIVKNIPLTFVFLSAVFINQPVVLVEVIIALITILFASFFMTHINVITDYELDKKKKPSFYVALNHNKNFSRKFIIFELFGVLVGLSLLLFFGLILPALFIAIFTVVAILYSYNFFSLKPIFNRLKVFWWGHFLVIILGYSSLWFAGLTMYQMPIESLKFWLVLFVLVSFSEYGVFLLESSIDHKEEKENNIQSMSTLIGERNTLKMSAFIGLVSSTFVICLMVFYPANSTLLIVAFLPAMIIRFIYEIMVIFVNEAKVKYKMKKYIPDILFIGTRLYTLILIIILR